MSALRQNLRPLHTLVLLHQALVVLARALPVRLPRVPAPLLGPSRWLVLESGSGPGVLIRLGRLTPRTLLSKGARWFLAERVPMTAIP